MISGITYLYLQRGYSFKNYHFSIIFTYPYREYITGTYTYINAIPPLYFPYSSALSPLYFRYTSPVSPPYQRVIRPIL